MEKLEAGKIFSAAPLLLVSVVNGAEAQAALQGGADIIDLKNPREGALGAPAPRVIQEVCAALKKERPFSIALGEFPGKPSAAALAAWGSAFFQPDFVKVAFLPDSPPEEIPVALQEIKISLQHWEGEKTICLVSVAFADRMGACSWSLADFALLSREGGADGCLVDTWEKKGRSLRDYLKDEEIGGWIDFCHRQGLFCGLAGALKFSDIPPLKERNPDLIGVRSAVCGGDRLGGRISAQPVRELKELCGRRENRAEDGRLPYGRYGKAGPICPDHGH